MRTRDGRPRIDGYSGFKDRFARVLPALVRGRISKGEAAKQLGISHRSLNRYLDNGYWYDYADNTDE